jgi:carbamoyltransferase
MKIVGVSPAHDSSICLLEDGVVKRFLKEERLTREKRDSTPIKSLSKLLDNDTKIDYCVYAPPAEGSWNQYFSDWATYINKFSKVDEFVDVSNEHHLQHASLAFYNSGFDEAAIIIADGAGSYIDGLQEVESIFIASYPDNIIPIYKNFWKKEAAAPERPYTLRNFPECEVGVTTGVGGIVLLYITGTTLIGQHPLENGKTMGLAAYGRRSNLPNFIINQSNMIDSRFFRQSRDGESVVYSDYFFDQISIVPKENYNLYADYAYHIQEQSEIAMEYLIRKAIEKTGLKNICISGGYGLNVVANLRFLKNFPGINFYFEPIADDSGNSIGAALLQYRKISRDKTINKINHTFYHGFEYPLSDIGSAVSYEDVSMMLNDNKSVGIYYKLAEAGPRALGHRSILFDPRNKNAKDLVNSIKKREWYRPFAAACLEEDAKKYFDLYDNVGYEFMTINADANGLAKIEIPGVLHVDDTCRIQIVKDESEPLYKLLKEFKKITGIGVLLNTSFNLAGEALVETPEDAVNTFNNSDLHCLWFPEIHQGLIKN